MLSTLAHGSPAPAIRAGRLEITIAPATDVAGAGYAEVFGESRATAFQHPLWLSHFYSTLAPAREATPVLVAGKLDGRPSFYLPMIRRRMWGTTLLEAADLGVCDYCAPVIRESDRGTLGETGDLAARVAQASGHHDILRIRNIREDHCPDWRLFFSAPARRLDFSSHETGLGSDHEIWSRRAYTESFAKYLKRRKNRFFRQPGARLVTIGNAAEACEAIGHLAELRQGRFEGDMIAMPAVRRFYAEIAEAGVENGFASVYRLEVGSETIGLVFGVNHGGRFLYLLIGCDYEKHGRHSPGLLIYDGIIEQQGRLGGHVFDFTIGDEPFKADFGTRAIPIHAMEAARTVQGRLALLLQPLHQQARRRLAAAMQGGHV